MSALRFLAFMVGGLMSFAAMRYIVLEQWIQAIALLSWGVVLILASRPR